MDVFSQKNLGTDLSSLTTGSGRCVISVMKVTYLARVVKETGSVVAENGQDMIYTVSTLTSHVCILIYVSFI